MTTPSQIPSRAHGGRWVPWIIGSVSAVVVLGGLAFFTLFNPLLLAFLANFEIKNDSGLAVQVTPIGMWEGSGLYGPLPTYRSEHPPAIPARAPCDIPLAPGETISITYDWDDINFRHLLVRVPDGRLLITDTDKMGSLHYCYGPQQKQYVIPPPNLVQEASSELAPCCGGKKVRYSGAIEYGAPESGLTKQP
jgi:hypothetical protein